MTQLLLAALQLSPVQLHVAPQTQTAMLQIKNPTAQEARLKLTVSSWRQTAAGEEQSPTSEVMIYPPLFTLAAGAERTVRIASRVKAGAVEQTYRLLIEELPDASASGGPSFALNYSLPIFVDPVELQQRPLALESARLSGAGLAFEAVNEGNAHLKIDAGTVKLSGADGKEIASVPLEGGYVLAGKRKRISIPLPAGECAKVKQVAVDGLVELKKLTAELNPEAACGEAR